MENINDPHRQAIVEAINNLLELENPIFSSCLGILMTGEWKEINDAFDVGDVYQFSLEQIERTNDPNVKKLVDLIKNLRSTAMTIQNLNMIKDEEINW